MLKLLLFGLFYLTQGCPLLGGDAIYEARALLAYRTDLVFNDDEACVVPTERNATIWNSVQLTPNPTSSFVNIPDDFIGAVGLILDQYGRVVKQTSQLQNMLNVQDLQSGVYYLTVKRKGEPNSTFKFVVIKP